MFRALVIALVMLVWLCPGVSTAADDAGVRLLRQPALSKDHLAFVYAGDIWVSDRDGQHPIRITSDPASEFAPHFSPDGQWIAFSAGYDNNVDVYVVSVNGGQPRRLTWHPARTPQEARDWVEYMTSDSDSTLANLRRKNGRDKPWNVSFLGVGNEPWGCGGNMRPEYYADEYRRYQGFLHAANGNIARYASGASGDDYRWTDVLMREAGTLMEGISLHYYTLPSDTWAHKGAATGFDEAAWAITLKRTSRMEELLQRHGTVMDKYDAGKNVALAVDEWGTWYDVAPGSNPGFLFQQNTLRDAVVAALNLNIFHAHADRVKMANIAQMVNVLQAMILTDGNKMILTPTYHVFEMYKVHQDATYLPVELASPPYEFGDVSIPAISASASRDTTGKVHLSLVNVDPHRHAQLVVHIPGLIAARVDGRVLTATAMDAHNSFDQPDVVKPAPFTGAKLERGDLKLMLPAQSVVVLELR